MLITMLYNAYQCLYDLFNAYKCLLSVITVLTDYQCIFQCIYNGYNCNYQHQLQLCIFKDNQQPPNPGNIATVTSRLFKNIIIIQICHILLCKP
ncbi:hypothetical protein CAEBREN_13439 [Caenorhabditis brenneri]|uniref:Uncharacterized protein n=1 Tax=Caenorhabditis brenneri TaxID=135651 RepID=G0N0C6_CAEBE|nr:hypothetical protein CAEBREN_13439 [Caenorhabditis brenneri]